MLVGLTLVAAAVAQRRRVLGHPSKRPAFPPLPRLGIPTALALVAAVVLTVIAVRTAADGLRDQRRDSHFSALWIVPAETGEVEVGLWNHQGSVHDYEVRVERDGTTLHRWGKRLGPYKHEEVLLAQAGLPGSGPVVVSLYRDSELYRRVELQAEGGP